MVEFTDGSTIAQLSRPDMRLPIGYALAWPARHPHCPTARIDWATLGRLDFEPPDLEAFPCLALAYEAGRIGGTAPAWLSARQRGRGGGLPRRTNPLDGHRRDPARRCSHGMMERRRRPPPTSSTPTPGPAPWPGKSCIVAPLERRRPTPHESGARRRHRRGPADRRHDGRWHRRRRARRPPTAGSARRRRTGRRARRRAAPSRPAAALEPAPRPTGIAARAAGRAGRLRAARLALGLVDAGRDRRPRGDDRAARAGPLPDGQVVRA